METPEVLYKKQKEENYIRENMDLFQATIEIGKIIEGHLLGIEFRTPKSPDILEKEHIVYQELLREGRTIYRTHMECKTQTEEELKERHLDFTKNIEPFIANYSKLIYSLIK